MARALGARNSSTKAPAELDPRITAGYNETLRYGSVVLVDQVLALAADLGYLARSAAGGYTCFLAERCCHSVESLHALLTPTAADFYRGHLLFGPDEAEAVREALAEADRRRADLRRRLGLDEDGHLCRRETAA